MFYFVILMLVCAPCVQSSDTVIYAGSSRTAFLPNAKLSIEAMVLNGSVPNNMWSWSVSHGDAQSVDFSSMITQEIEVTFSSEGVYELQVESGGGGLSHVIVEVYDTTKGVTRNFGYNISTLQRFFTSDAQHQFDVSAIQSFRSVLSPPPPPGVHPRVLFSPSDIPDMRQRLKGTVVGLKLYNIIRDRIVHQMTGGTDSTGRYYSKENRTSQAMGIVFDGLASGNITAFNNTDGTTKNVCVGLITYIGFVLQLFPDELPSGTTQAACIALATVAKKSGEDIKAQLPKTGCSRWQRYLCDYREMVQGLIYREFMGLAYDMLAPMMTPAQKGTLQATLSLATTEMWSIGMDSLRSLSSGTSNWVPTHMMHLMMNTLSIEGEPGYDANLLPRLIAGYDRFLSAGLMPDGATFEGMGKDSIWAQVLIVLGRRGSLFPAHSSVTSHARKFYLAVASPFGWTVGSDAGGGDGSFTWDEMDGGIQSSSKYADIATLKYFYSKDKTLDFIFRTEMANLTRLHDFNIRFPYKGMEFLVRAICARDWMSPSDSWAEAQLALAEEANLTNFFNHRGLFSARSDWSTNAVQVLFQPRSVVGGHSQLDRTKIGMNALGRWWIPYRPIDQPANIASIVYVNGNGPSDLPTTVVAVYDSGDISSFAVSDAALAYSQALTPSTNPSGEPAFFSENEFLYEKNENILYSGLPYNLYPDWNSSMNTNTSVTKVNATTNVSEAFRTVGLVRPSATCDHMSYVVVVDHIARAMDVQTSFTWRAMLPSDFTFDNVTFNGADCYLIDSSGNKLDLDRTASANGTKLLLRQVKPYAGLAWSKATVQTCHDDKCYPVLGVDANVTVSGGTIDLVTLLFPLRDGEQAPKTNWDQSLNSMTVTSASGCVDTLTLMKSASENFDRVSVKRSSFS
eukprot:m.13465 g.13465  ORF g.13465 m.13465 type:complete len:907 (-) comp4861_c0_seq1:27-2747(-)